MINVISTNSRKNIRKRQRSEEDDASLDISQCTIKLILVNMGSTTNVLFKDAFDQMGILPEEIEPWTILLVGFTGRSISSIGSITLPLTIEGYTRHLDFLIVDTPSLYNMILGRLALNALKVPVSVYSTTIVVKIRNVCHTIMGDKLSPASAS